jgi:signal transduction histidine kinase/CheY-like chemotaxis protein
LYVLASVLFVAYSVYTVFHFGGGWERSLFLKWVNDAVTIFAAAICYARAIYVAEKRFAWALIGSSMLLWAIGNIYYSLYVINLNPLPVPSVADYLWLAIYPGLFVGVVMLLRSGRTTYRVGVWLDGAVAGLSLCAVSAAIVLGVVLQGASAESTGALITNVAYPVGDMVVLGVIATALTLRHWRLERMWVALALGAIAFTVTDGLFLLKTANGSYEVGTIIDAGWLFAALMLATAAWQPLSGRTEEEADATASRLLVPALLGGASLTLLIWDHFERTNTIALVLASAAVVTVLARMVITFRDNLSLLLNARGEALLLAEQNTSLQELAEVREQFRQSQKMEAVGQLAGGIAHDFNNLLTAINGYGELAAGHTEDERVRGEIGELLKASERAAELTGQLLAFSRRQRLQPCPIDLNQLVLELDSLLRRLIGEHIALRTVPHSTPAWIEADPGQIEQVVVNLVVNARDAMPGGGTVIVQVAGNGQVELIVSDTGCGMDDRTRAQAFEPFFTTKQPGEGTGLGLSTVYGIVSQSGGEISFETEPDRGTVFTISLPRIEVPNAPIARGPRVRHERFGDGCILVVEDEDAVRAVTVRFLEGAGYTVLQARDGQDALAILEREVEEVDLLLTDVVMPRMSGPDLANRAMTLRPSLKLIFCSGYPRGLLDDQDAHVNTPFLSKPFTRADLIESVRAVVDSADKPQPITTGY